MSFIDDALFKLGYVSKSRLAQILASIGSDVKGAATKLRLEEQEARYVANNADVAGDQAVAIAQQYYAAAEYAEKRAEEKADRAEVLEGLTEAAEETELPNLSALPIFVVNQPEDAS